MASLHSTTAHARAGLVSTASLSAPLSPLASLDHHQARRCSAYGVLRHGRRIAPDQSNPAAVLLDLSSQVCSGKLRAVAHVADARSFIRRSRQAPALLSIHAPGSRPVMAQSVRDQLPQQFAIAKIPHAVSALRCSPLMETSWTEWMPTRWKLLPKWSVK